MRTLRALRWMLQTRLKIFGGKLLHAKQVEFREQQQGTIINRRIVGIDESAHLVSPRRLVPIEKKQVDKKLP